MISVVNASRWYGQVIGINDITCEIGTGITALLGQNGAGKSTLIKLLTGQLRPTTGEVRVFGRNPFANPAVLGQLGYCPEVDAFYEEMTGREFVELMARMGRIERSRVKSEAQRALELVEMQDRADRKVAGFSKGMRQRIKLAAALVHEPDILILDEPLNGLDPLGRRHVGQLLKDLAGAGKTVLISSHILHEIEALTSTILLLHRGRLLAQGDVRTIRSLIDRHPHHIRIRTDDARSLGVRILELPSVLSVELSQNDPHAIELQTNQPDAFYTAFGQLVVAESINVESMYSPDNNLESVFSYLVRS
ncbi:MAG: ABC transporter ATP-binding protein [Armatimonadetes bacterium]|nr:ABC transporter ATP-binding protein [Armatimonadota bacterium]NOG93146.1 ABC transporter ATP-binding protein [Armatimonadota bacterium]